MLHVGQIQHPSLFFYLMNQHPSLLIGQKSRPSTATVAGVCLLQFAFVNHTLVHDFRLAIPFGYPTYPMKIIHQKNESYEN